MIRTGVDLVDVPRLREALRRRPRLEERLFSEAEREWCRRRRDPVPGFAVRMAAKEAVGKLLGTGVTSWQEIEVLPGPPPRVALRGRAAEAAGRLGLGEIGISLTHSEAMAGATAVAAAQVAPYPRAGAPGEAGGTQDAGRPAGREPAEPVEQGEAGMGHLAEDILRAKPASARPAAFTSEQMRELDRRTIEEVGVPSPVLMERAALGVSAVILERFAGRHTLMVCGRGNNGGDGLAAARQLHLAGHPVACAVAASSPEELSADAALNLKTAEGAGVNLRMGTVPDYLWEESGLVVDCLLGTGAAGELREPYAEWARRINRAGERGVPVLAVDLPTGVDARDGSVAAEAVAASLTVTFHAPKAGLLAPPGSEAAGELLVWDIGIPRYLEPEPDAVLFRLEDVRVPGRRPDDHKYRAGFVAVVAGSAAYPGAALLTAQAAAKAGAGYVRLVVPAGAARLLRGRVLELVVREAGAGDALEDIGALQEAAGDENIGALVIGPGIGRAAPTLDVIRALVSDLDKPAIIDAEGLLAFAGRPRLLQERGPGLVLTPHAGELAALLGEEVREVTHSHLAAARRGARATGQVVLLKGSSTVVATPEGRTWAVAGAGPQLASAGTGDVLSGVIGTLLARGMAPAEAAAAGAALHAEAGRRAGVVSRGGVLAGDLLGYLPAVLSERIYERRPGWRT